MPGVRRIASEPALDASWAIINAKPIGANNNGICCGVLSQVERLIWLSRVCNKITVGVVAKKWIFEHEGDVAIEEFF